MKRTAIVGAGTALAIAVVGGTGGIVATAAVARPAVRGPAQHIPRGLIAVTLVEVLRHRVSELQTVGYSSSMASKQVKAEMQVYLSSLARAESILGRIVSLDACGGTR